MRKKTYNNCTDNELFHLPEFELAQWHIIAFDLGKEETGVSRIVLEKTKTCFKYSHIINDVSPFSIYNYIASYINLAHTRNEELTGTEYKHTQMLYRIICSMPTRGKARTSHNQLIGATKIFETEKKEEIPVCRVHEMNDSHALKVVFGKAPRKREERKRLTKERYATKNDNLADAQMFLSAYIKELTAKPV